MSSSTPPWDRLLAIWNGEADLDDLDDLVTAEYVGHIGSRARDVERLKQDIVAYRAQALAVVFRIQHQFRDGEFVATRLTARVSGPDERTIAGLNISRWKGERLAEEWAVWERFDAT